MEVTDTKEARSKTHFEPYLSYMPVQGFKRQATQLHLALVQFEGTVADPEGNTAHAVELIRQAAADGADMVVLPELFATGYNLDIIGSRIQELAEPIDGPTVTALRAVAAECGVYVVAGVALFKDLTGIPYNSSVFIGRDGQLVGTADKMHLWALERFYFRAGSEQPVFVTEFGAIGVLICYDLGFPEDARMLALKGADVLLCPSAWCEPDHDVWNINTTCRALENTVFLAGVNRYAHEEDLFLGGHTRMCNPRGGVIDEIMEEGEGILHVTIDLNDMLTHRTNSPYLKDRRPEIYDDVITL